MSHKEAPPETDSQRACREWWTERLGATTVGWGRDKSGKFLAEFARNAQAAWEAAEMPVPKRVDARQLLTSVAAYFRNSRVVNMWEGPDGCGTSGTDACEDVALAIERLAMEAMALGITTLPTPAPFTRGPNA